MSVEAMDPHSRDVNDGHHATSEHEAKQRLEEQDRLAAMGQLAAGIAHDFNNLLTVVIGLADLLRADPSLPPTARARLDTIAAHGRRGSRLIGQILDFSRRSVREPRPFDLRPLLTEVASLLERTLPENVTLHVEVGSGAHGVYADPTQLQHLIANLALNARDAMPHGGHLTLGLARLALRAADTPPVVGMEPGEWITLSVSDTGTGIPPAVQEHVFEPFFTTKGPGKGTGLGLAQVHGIVAQHAGFIGLQSVPGWGTQFTVHLPAVRTAEAPAMHRTPTDPLPVGHGETVLLVEDDPATCEVTEEALRHLGYRVLVADSGEKALDLWGRDRQSIALVLTDLVMAGMGGAALYRALRRRSGTVPVVVMSGHPLGVERNDPSLRGISNWLQKPADIDQLAQAVDRALRDEAAVAT